MGGAFLFFSAVQLSAVLSFTTVLPQRTQPHGQRKKNGTLALFLSFVSLWSYELGFRPVAAALIRTSAAAPSPPDAPLPHKILHSVDAQPGNQCSGCTRPTPTVSKGEIGDGLTPNGELCVGGRAYADEALRETRVRRGAWRRCSRRGRGPWSEPVQRRYEDGRHWDNATREREALGRASSD